jgi:hypothetical protein
MNPAASSRVNLPAAWRWGEPHRPAGVAKVGASGVLQQREQLLHLAPRRRRPGLVSECHAPSRPATQSRGWPDPQPKRSMRRRVQRTTKWVASYPGRGGNPAST